MNWNIEITKEQVVVSLTVEHIRNTRDEKATYTVDDARDYLAQQNIKTNKVVSDCVVHNYQTQQRCSGVWIFSLPNKPKKPPKTVEKKENVTKITNKKTIKK
tara:strand:- start:225 stop:530 length:306 start_codon:yes stop_codon:yes gene_type:complete